MSEQRPAPGAPPRAPSPAPAATGPVWSTVVTRGGPPNTGQRGTSQHVGEGPGSKASGPPKVDNGVPFSALHLVKKTAEEVAALDWTAVPPVRIVPNQHDYPCLGYTVPAGTTYTEIQDAFNEKGDVIKGMLHLTFYRSSNLAVVRFDNEEDKLTFLTEPVVVRGQPARLSQFFAYTPDLAFVMLTGLQEANPRDAASKIEAALNPFGRLVDIVLFKRGKFLASIAQVVVSLAEGTTVDGLLELDGYSVNAIGKRVEKACIYCKERGHIKAECLNRPQ
ncbi:hypothetical protein GGI15_000523, partial [Coemansia interrupta]